MCTELQTKGESDMSIIRTFPTGATRDSEAGKLDYEGFLSPFALEAYAEYMNYHRVQSDGTLRASDNWQRGIPIDQYMKSLFRHFMAAWKTHRGGLVFDERDHHLVGLREALCGVLFNAFGLLHVIETASANTSSADAPNKECP